MEQLLDNRYRIIKPLGSGGMAEVYLAHDAILERDVALKVMSERYADDDEFVERFKREAQSAAVLSHPNIVSIYDRGRAKDGTYYIAMEYLPGGTLKDYILKRGALPPRTAAAVALQIAEALQGAHHAGVIHRDIKPHNVLVTDAGDIKVGDFGIARAASSNTMTRTGSILGTAHYISPEQAMGEPVGPQSDLYSLGVVLYEMLTGALPYDAETSIGVAMKHVNGYLVPPKDLNPEVSEGMNAITIRLLEKNPNERYAEAGELIQDLERVLEGLEPVAMGTAPMNRVTSAETAQSRTVSPLLEDKPRRGPWITVLLLLLLLLAMFGGLAYAAGWWEPVSKVEVPNLVGVSSLQEARTNAENLELALGSRVKSEEPIGTIVGQIPEAGGTVDRGSIVYVDVSDGVELPDVRGAPRDEAVQILEGADFRVDEETEESSAENKGYVTRQDPRGGEGETVEAGSRVAITIGGGPATIEVPNLYNYTPQEARQVLEGAGLSLGSQTQASSDQVSEGQIVDQRPSPASQAEPGSSVDITVSSGPEQMPVPDVVGSNVEEAGQTLWDSGFGSTVETVQSDQPAGTVVSTDPSAGTLLDPYSRNVTIRQSLGPSPPAPSAPVTSTPKMSTPNSIGASKQAEQTRQALEKALNKTLQKAQKESQKDKD